MLKCKVKLSSCVGCCKSGAIPLPAAGWPLIYTALGAEQAPGKKLALVSWSCLDGPHGGRGATDVQGGPQGELGAGAAGQQGHREEWGKGTLHQLCLSADAICTDRQVAHAPGGTLALAHLLRQLFRLSSGFGAKLQINACFLLLPDIDRYIDTGIEIDKIDR